VATIEIFSPLGRPASRAQAELNPFPDLRGATIGVLDNTKPNARPVLEGVARRIAEDHGATEVVIERKRSAAEGAPPELIRKLSGAAHLVFAGSGD
jgi:hypothetical protein